MYVTASPAQNQNSSFFCHFSILLTDKRDSTLTGTELACPFGAGKWPLTLTGPWGKHKDNLQGQKGHRCVRVPLSDESHYHPKCISNALQTFFLKIFSTGWCQESNPDPKYCDGNRHRELHQHLPNTSGPVNHNIALRPPVLQRSLLWSKHSNSPTHLWFHLGRWLHSQLYVPSGHRWSIPVKEMCAISKEGEPKFCLPQEWEERLHLVQLQRTWEGLLMLPSGWQRQSKP